MLEQINLSLHIKRYLRDKYLALGTQSTLYLLTSPRYSGSNEGNLYIATLSGLSAPVANNVLLGLEAMLWIPPNARD